MKRKLLLGTLGLLLLVSITILVAFGWLRRSGLPIRSGEHSLAGLEAPVSVHFNAQGVPHLHADNEEDLAAAQGFIHANDRLVQMELGRRAAAGRLAEILGPSALETDIYFRTLRLGRTAEAMAEQATPRSRLLLEAYARGVNAWLASRGRDLPPELRILGVTPEPWRPADSLAFALLMANDLSFWRGLPEEARFLWLRAFGAEGVRELLAEPALHIPEEIQELALETVRATLVSPHQQAQSESSEGREARLLTEELATPGSNNWALGGSRTATGKALLANDPHLGLVLPSVWYQVHLRSPTYEAAGMSIPGAPGVVLGRGRHLAWAFTNTMLDDHDLFFERLDDQGEQYLRADGWHPLVVEEETIPIRDGASHILTLRSTDIGPLLAADIERGLPPRSLAWTAFAGGDSVAAFVDLAQARTPEEVLAAVEPHVCPAQNLVVALETGELLFTVIGRVPDRRGDPRTPSAVSTPANFEALDYGPGSALGRFPAPAWNPDYGWQGLRPRRSNPTILAPSDDALVTANHDILPPAYPLSLAADFFADGRAERIVELLAERQDWDTEGFRHLQTDITSLFARQLVSALGGGYEGDAAQALGVLRGWDGGMRTRGPAALYALLERKLLEVLFADEAVSSNLEPFAQRDTVLHLLRGEMNPRWFDDLETPEEEDRRTILSRALAGAWQEGHERWGDDVNTWPYGALHTLTLRHPLDPVPLLGRWLRRGPWELPGAATTVAAFGARWQGDRQEVVYGPSMRWVVDWSRPETALAALPGGQSGHPADPHYDDRIESYLAGKLEPAPWSEDAIAAATVSTLSLLP